MDSNILTDLISDEPGRRLDGQGIKRRISASHLEVVIPQAVIGEIISVIIRDEKSDMNKMHIKLRDTVKVVLDLVEAETCMPAFNVEIIEHIQYVQTVCYLDSTDALIPAHAVNDPSSVKGHISPIGIITERDIIRRVLAGYESIDPKQIIVSDIMSKPLITVGNEASIYDAALIMTKYSIRRLPIPRDNVLLGIVTATDLARRVYEKNKDPVLKAMSRFGLLEQQ